MICQSKGKVPPTIRFYQWNPPTVTIGYFQKINDEIDVTTCEEMGFNCVRRLTGGRAVLHNGELTYSLVASEDDPHIPGGVLSSYLAIARGLLAGLRNLGLAGELVEGGVVRTKGTAACFDAPSWYEITVGGKKVIGSAQTRKHGSILQHGSIPVFISAEEVCNLLTFRSPQVEAYARQRLKDKAAGVAQLLGREPSLQAMEKAFFNGFAEGLHLELVEDQLSEEEMELAKRLCEDKYRQPDWNYKR